LFRKPAVAVVILLAILAAPAARGAAASDQHSHTVTVNVPAFDAVKLTVLNIGITLQQLEEGIGFESFLKNGGHVQWATNDSPRAIYVGSDSVPPGMTLKVRKSLDPEIWVDITSGCGSLVDDASCRTSTTFPKAFPLEYEVSVDLTVRANTYAIEITYTLTV